MTDPAYPALFSPIEVAGRRLRNRVCLCATVTNLASGNRITDPWRNFLIERARGGAAMLVTEIIAVDPEAIAQSTTVIGFEPVNDDAFRAIARDVHGEGALLIGQLWHPGRQQLWHPTKAPIGVSDLPDPYSWTVPHVMSTDEVVRVVGTFVETARRLHDCGFDGVELHGAHGYLIMQFLSPASNTRTDIYGGDLEGRTRFVREIAAGIRAACGSSFAIGLKAPADEGVPGGIDPDEAERITRRLAATGDFDYLAYGQGNFSLSLETHVPDLYFRPGHFIDLHRRMREAAGGIPVMALGRIGTPELADRVVAEGYGDLVGMTRALIADAAWANKAMRGQAGDIRPSVFDNFPWGEVHRGKPVADHHTPHIGRAGEADKAPEPAANAKRVLVIGGGPAGLETAWVAAARGHGVTMFCGGSRPGGALRLEADLPGRDEMGRIIEHQLRMCERYGVEIVAGHRADADRILSYDADAVVLATGSVQRPPPGLEPGPRVLPARDFVAAGHGLRGECAVLVDEDQTAAVYGVADLLARSFRRVILTTSRPAFAGGVNHCSAIGVFRRLHSAGVALMPALETVRFADGVFELRNPYSLEQTAIEGVDLVVHATPRIACDRLLAELGGLEVHLVGDCRSPRNLQSAILGGHGVAENL